MYAKYMKRLLDILLSLTILIVLSPLLLVLCILVRSKLGSPIFFKQERPGLHEKIFTMYKFRTMTDKRDAEGNLLPAHPASLPSRLHPPILNFRSSHPSY